MCNFMMRVSSYRMFQDTDSDQTKQLQAEAPTPPTSPGVVGNRVKAIKATRCYTFLSVRVCILSA